MMRRRISDSRAARAIVLMASIGLAAPLPLAAQWNAARLDGVAHRVSASAGLDPAVLGTLGYDQRFRVMGHAVHLGADGSVVGGRPDVDDYRVRLHAQSVLLRWREVYATGGLAFITRGTSNSTHRALNLGADAGGAVGYYRRHWFVAGEVGFDKAIVTHLTHTDWYRATFYGDAKDGWYLDTGGTWRFGTQVGASMGHTELVLRAGIPRTERGDPLATPAYATLSLGRTF